MVTIEMTGMDHTDQEAEVAPTECPTEEEVVVNLALHPFQIFTLTQEQEQVALTTLDPGGTLTTPGTLTSTLPETTPAPAVLILLSLSNQSR